MRDYNASINVLGSIADLNIIIETIRDFNDHKDIELTKQEFVEGNAFGFNISSSRKRFFAFINKLYLSDPDEKSNSFFIDTISNTRPNITFKKMILYIETYRRNLLFKDITKELIYKKYHENRRLVSTEEIYEFLSEFGKGTKLEEWTYNTVRMLGSKYISFMKRVGLFKKDKGRKSMIVFPFPEEKLITYIIYLLKNTELSDNEIYNSDIFDSLMLRENEKIELLKKSALKGYFDFSFSGTKNATFDLKYDREEIINELFN